MNKPTAPRDPRLGNLQLVPDLQPTIGDRILRVPSAVRRRIAASVAAALTLVGSAAASHVIFDDNPDPGRPPSSGTGELSQEEKNANYLGRPHGVKSIDAPVDRSIAEQAAAIRAAGGTTRAASSLDPASIDSFTQGR